MKWPMGILLVLGMTAMGDPCKDALPSLSGVNQVARYLSSDRFEANTKNLSVEERLLLGKLFQRPIVGNFILSLPENMRLLGLDSLTDHGWIDIQSQFKEIRKLGVHELSNIIYNPRAHSDHGMLHVIDVARKTDSFLVNLMRKGRNSKSLLQKRNQRRVTMMREYAKFLILMHDRGMTLLTREGRNQHAQVAARMVYNENFGPVLDGILSGKSPVIRKIKARFPLTAREVLQEMLSLSVAHSKKDVSSKMLGNPKELAKFMRAITSRPKGYRWLDGRKDTFVLDVLDTLRVVRAGDALRNRGRKLTGSAGHNMELNSVGGAEITLRNYGNRDVLRFISPNPITIGELNLEKVQYSNGQLHFTINSGNLKFMKPTARVIKSIVDDVIESFEGTRGATRSPGKVKVILHYPERERETIPTLSKVLHDRSSPFSIRQTVEFQEWKPMESLQKFRDWETNRWEQGRSDLTENLQMLQRAVMSEGMALRNSTLVELAKVGRRIQVSPGQILSHQGNPSQYVYLVQSQTRARFIGTQDALYGHHRAQDLKLDPKDSVQVLAFSSEQYLKWHNTAVVEHWELPSVLESKYP